MMKVVVVIVVALGCGGGGVQAPNAPVPSGGPRIPLRTHAPGVLRTAVTLENPRRPLGRRLNLQAAPPILALVAECALSRAKTWTLPKRANGNGPPGVTRIKLSYSLSPAQPKL